MVAQVDSDHLDAERSKLTDAGEVLELLLLRVGQPDRIEGQRRITDELRRFLRVDEEIRRADPAANPRLVLPGSEEVADSLRYGIVLAIIRNTVELRDGLAQRVADWRRQAPKLRGHSALFGVWKLADRVGRNEAIERLVGPNEMAQSTLVSRWILDLAHEAISVNAIE